MEPAHILLYLIFHLAYVCAECPHERSDLKRWSSLSTWDCGHLPHVGDSVNITTAVLMDVMPASLYNITILDGGMLTFLPDIELSLSVANIYIYQGGAMEIGSEACPYRGRLTITLTGNRKSHEEEKHPKVILVDAGGTLEIHGEPRLSWTKITDTLVPHTGYDSGQYYFNHKFEHEKYHNVTPWFSDVVAYTFTFNSSKIATVKDFGVYNFLWHNDDLAEHINRVTDGDIIMMACQLQVKRKDGYPPRRNDTFDAYETLIYGEITGESILRSMSDNGSTWAFVYQKGNPESYAEDTNTIHTTSAARFYMAEDVIFTAESPGSEWELVSNMLKLKRSPNFIISTTDGIFPLVETTDDVTTWQDGDRVVISSTDYAWNQAEAREVVFCPDCGNKQFRINKPVHYVHYGKVLHGAVDMRAEIGLLTRKLVICGEMEPTCPEYNGNCADSHVRQRDTFGGHIKILRGYANVHIENAEIYNMGQQTDAGRYPIHFHMAMEKIPEATVPYVKGNAIHDTFARCVTIHGSHGVEVIDNFCHNHMGHGFFLEDGGEQNNTLDGNLAMSTRKGTGFLEPVDLSRPAGFWITNPLNRIRNNVAAGGEGTGIWVLFPNEPLPPSRNYGFMEEFEAKKTMLLEFDNNVAHSQQVFGVMIGDRETEERDRHCCNQWQPLEDPKDHDSEPIEINLSRITGYKNRNTNIWIEGGFLNVTQVSVSDSLNGIFVTNEGQQFMRAGRLSHAVVIGDSENVGVPSLDEFNRSFPLPWHEADRQRPHSGVTMWKGPTQYSDIWFDGFQRNDIYDIAAIAKKRNSPYFFSVTTPFRNIQFAFDESESGGRYAISGDKDIDAGWELERDGQLIAGFTFDTNTSGSVQRQYWVKPDHLSAAASDCIVRPFRRLAYCQTKYGNLKVAGGFHDLESNGVFVRDDLPSAQLEFELRVGTGPQVVMDGSRTYTFHVIGEIPEWIQLTAEGIEIGDTLRIGICTPPGSELDIQNVFPGKLWTVEKFTRVNSLAELDATDSELDGKKYYMDNTTGMLYYKFVGVTSLGPDEAAACGGGRCPDFKVMVKSGNLTDGDCRQRLYGSQLDMEKPTLEIDTDVYPANGGSTPPSGYGAGPTRPFTNRVPVNGLYGDWSAWTACSKTCNEGIQYRIRRCDSPLPANNGTECVGPSVESQPCTTEPCAIHGGFAGWTVWSTCRAFNDTYCSGVTERYRTCSEPVVQFGGESCEGNTGEMKPCSVC